jgi:transglutaminase-like putative cysteine protease
VRDCQAFDRRRFPRIAATAEEVLREAEALDGDTIRKVRVLESHFLQSNRYRYSLDLRFRRSPNQDPIEAFIAEHRTGHCQYFATALTLMLRSQRIPARIVNGYKGGEYNSVGNYWQFRQRDAHAWVEVHLTPDEVAELNLARGQGDARGGWWRLDPTPNASSVAFQRQSLCGSHPGMALAADPSS